MADKDNSTPAPKGVSWLDEVRADAEYNVLKRIRDEKEKREHEEAKAKAKSGK